MGKLAEKDLLSLSIAERIQLVEDIWDSIASVPGAVHLSEEQKVELDRRLDEYHADPAKGSPWNVIRDRIRGKP